MRRRARWRALALQQQPDGRIVEVNEALADDPELINADPHVDGWLVKVRYSASSDLDSLMDAEAYGEFVQQGKH